MYCQATLNSIDISYQTVKDCDLTDCYLHYCDLINCNLINCTIDNCRTVNCITSKTKPIDSIAKSVILTIKA